MIDCVLCPCLCRYGKGDLEDSLRVVKLVLAREPRHPGALCGVVLGESGLSEQDESHNPEAARRVLAAVLRVAAAMPWNPLWWQARRAAKRLEAAGVPIEDGIAPGEVRN